MRSFTNRLFIIIEPLKGAIEYSLSFSSIQFRYFPYQKFFAQTISENITRHGVASPYAPLDHITSFAADVVILNRMQPTSRILPILLINHYP